MNERNRLSSSLTESLSLSLPPIAVMFTDSAPASIAAWKGAVPAGCRFWQEAAQRAFVTTTGDHELCGIGVHTHQLSGARTKTASELVDALKVMGELGYVREEDVPKIPIMSTPHAHVVYAPLADSPLAPDVVLLFAHSRQGLVLTEAIEQVDESTPPALGRPACAIVPHVINTGRAALSLGCCGARAYLDALDDTIALWALPGAKIAEYAERIAVFARANDVLGKFHALRREDVKRGKLPTIQQSLARLEG